MLKYSSKMPPNIPLNSTFIAGKELFTESKSTQNSPV